MTGTGTMDHFVLGTMDLGGCFDGLVNYPRPSDEAQALIAAAERGGLRTFDTAPIYAKGVAEAYLGRFADPASAVWTKVGVDIRGLLPRLDYSYDGMRRSLEGSLDRLRRDRVEVVLLHNAPAAVLGHADSLKFAAWALAEGLAGAVGASVLELSDALAIPDSRLLSVLMVEGGQLDAVGSAAALALSTRFRLVVRSILAGGAAIAGAEDVALTIRRRIEALETELHAARIVVGPRTMDQLATYAGLLDARARRDAGPGAAACRD